MARKYEFPCTDSVLLLPVDGVQVNEAFQFHESRGINVQAYET